MGEYKFEEITGEELNAFSAKFPQGNFQQTTTLDKMRELRGQEVAKYGVRKGDELVAAVLVIFDESHGSKFGMVHDGPLCDFTNGELTSFLFSNLKEVCKQKGCAQIGFTPELPYNVWNTDATEKLQPTKDEAYKNLLACGLIHEGFDRKYNPVPRWRYVKDLTGIESEEALLSSYQKNTKRNVRIATENGVVIKDATRDDMQIFHDICEMSCEKQGFANRDVEHFYRSFDNLRPTCEFKIAWIDAKAHLKSWEDKRDGFARDIEKYKKNIETAQSPDKFVKKLKDVESKYEASLKRIELAKSYIEEDGEMIPAAVSQFVWHPRECVYLTSGVNPKYAKFYAETAIQHYMMCECLKRGCNRYNFYGINGVFDDPNDPGRGLIEFKQGFNGFVEELMGSFTLPVKALQFKAKQLAHKLLKR